MKKETVIKAVLSAVTIAALVGATIVLRNATLSVSVETPSDSTTDIVVRGRTKQGELIHNVGTRVSASLAICEIEVNARQIHGPDPLDDDRFAITFQPALSETDQKQYRGCVTDWNVDGVLVDIESMVHHGVDEEL